MRLAKKIVLWCAIVFAVFTLFGFFAAPPLLKAVLVKQLSTALHRSVSVGKISINPYTLTAIIRDVSVKDRGSDAKFIAFRELEASVSLSIIKGNIALSRIILREPYVGIIRNSDGTYNFSDILEEKPAAKGKKIAKKSEPVTFSLSGIKIEKGSVDFTDAPMNKKHEIRDLNLVVPFLSNRPKDIKTDVRPLLSLKINGAPYEIEGKTKPFAESRETNFDIKIDDIDVPYYLAYIPATMPCIIKSGLLSTDLQLLFTEYKNSEPSLTLKGIVTLAQLSVTDLSKKPLLDLPKLEVSLNSVEPLAGKIHLAKISIQSPEINLRKDKKGNINIGGPASEKEKPKGGDGKGKTTSTPERTDKPVKEAQETPLQLLVDTIELTDGKANYHDEPSGGPVQVAIEKMELKGEAFSLEKNAKGKFSASLALNKKGQVNIDGTVCLTPLAVEAKVAAKNIEIRPFEPYFSDKLKVDIIRGAVQVNGDLTLAQKPKEDLASRFQGTASITNFKTNSREDEEKLLRMDSLYLKGIDYTSSPSKLTIKGVALTDFDAVVTVNDDKSINLQNILAKEEATGAGATSEPSGGAQKTAGDASTKKKDEPMLVVINTVTLQGGNVDFNDYSVEPEFSSKLSEMTGRISGLSSKPGTTADVDLKAKYNEFAPLEITGKINPLRDDLYVDLKASFRDMDLSPATPYSGKYAGYAIDKGKLSLDVQYLIENKKLDSKNVIFIDQLTFGNKVESPDATKLPVKLAVALLKDRKGQIKLDIPVTGSLDDPKFSVWKIVLKVIMNLLAKAATSPFALIGSLFGGGEELGYVEFDYGRDTVNEANLKKIDTLVKVLQEKPDLRLDITGYVDQDRDKEGLKQYLFQKKIRAQKLKNLLKKKTENPNIDDVKIEPQEYENYLRLAYKAEKFPKPRNVLGLEKTVPVEEMEKLMLTHIEIKNEDLRTLAMSRTAKVKEAILKSGAIDASRIFAVEPKSLTPEAKEKLKASRVEFSLK